MQKIDISDLLGVPYKKNGRTLNGLDCYGLVIEVCKRFGHKLRDFDYTDTSSKTFKKILSSVEPEKEGLKLAQKPSEGDILLFSTDKCFFANHCGVYLGDGFFIHCDYFGVHVQKISSYTGEIKGVYRWL